MERWTSLGVLQRAWASSWNDCGTTWFFSSCDGIFELPQGIHASSGVGPQKSYLPFDVDFGGGWGGGCKGGTLLPAHAGWGRPRFLSSLDMNIRSCTQTLVGSLLPSVTRAHLQLFLESRMEDKTFVGQHKRKHEFPVVTQISHRNSRKTKWFCSHSKMRPLPSGAPQEKSNVPF